MTSGSRGNSDRCSIALGKRWVVFANQGAVMIDGPVSHGSMRTVDVGVLVFSWASLNVSRNVESALRCLTVSVIVMPADMED